MWQKAVLLSSFFAVAACSGMVATEGPGEVVTPTSLKVTAAVSGVTLGDEGCAAAAAGLTAAPDARCGGAAPPPPAESGKPGSGSGDSAPGFCGGCRQSSVQISFKASAEGTAAPIEISSVVLIEDSGRELEVLTPSNPKAWNGSGYAVWNQTIAPGADVRSSFSLSSPAWSKHGSSFSKQYKVRITVKVGDGTTVIDSALVSREAQVAT